MDLELVDELLEEVKTASRNHGYVMAGMDSDSNTGLLAELQGLADDYSDLLGEPVGKVRDIILDFIKKTNLLTVRANEEPVMVKKYSMLDWDEFKSRSIMSMIHQLMPGGSIPSDMLEYIQQGGIDSLEKWKEFLELFPEYDWLRNSSPTSMNEEAAMPASKYSLQELFGDKYDDLQKVIDTHGIDAVLQGLADDGGWLARKINGIMSQRFITPEFIQNLRGMTSSDIEGIGLNEEPVMVKKYDIGDLMSAIRSVVEDAYDKVVMTLGPDEVLKQDIVGKTTQQAMTSLQSLIKAQGLSVDMVKDAAEKIAQNLKETESIFEEEDIPTMVKKSVLSRLFGGAETAASKHTSPEWSRLFEDDDKEDLKRRAIEAKKKVDGDDDEEDDEDEDQKKEKEAFSKFVDSSVRRIMNENGYPMKGKDKEDDKEKKDMAEQQGVAAYALKMADDKVASLEARIQAQDAKMAAFEESKKLSGDGEREPTLVSSAPSTFEKAYEEAIKTGKTPSQAYAEAAKGNKTEHIKHLDRVTVG